MPYAYTTKSVHFKGQADLIHKQNIVCVFLSANAIQKPWFVFLFVADALYIVIVVFMVFSKWIFDEIKFSSIEVSVLLRTSTSLFDYFDSRYSSKRVSNITQIVIPLNVHGTQIVTLAQCFRLFPLVFSQQAFALADTMYLSHVFFIHIFLLAHTHTHTIDIFKFCTYSLCTCRFFPSALYRSHFDIFVFFFSHRFCSHLLNLPWTKCQIYMNKTNTCSQNALETERFDWKMYQSTTFSRFLLLLKIEA